MIIQSKRVYVEGSFIQAALEIKNKKILRFYRYDSIVPDVDYGDRRLVPGFIDIHCHGAYGWDTNDAGPDGLMNWARRLPDEGVTSFCPTTVTQTKDVLVRALANVRAVKETYAAGRDGADILGVHLEGPFINPDYRGSQPAEAISSPDIREFEDYQQAGGGQIRIVTLAPEMDADHKLIRYLREHNVRVSIGHTGADYEEAVMAAADGAVSITHVYNAQTPFWHRDNGVTGAALRLTDMYSEIIADCIHSTPEALHIFYANKSRNKAIMITDSLLCKGCDAGVEYLFGGNRIKIMGDGVPHLADRPEGSIAGSVLYMNQGLRNLVEKAMIPFDTAINSCTVNPASLLGLDDHLGKLKAGYDADIVVLEDDYSVLETYCKGTPFR